MKSRRSGSGQRHRWAWPVLGFLGGKLTGLLINLVQFPTLKPARPPPDRAEPPTAPEQPDRAALLIPVRNEADRLPATLPGFLAAAAAGVETIFLDDNSTDGTRELLEAAARSATRVTVLTGLDRPDGWSGKTWACQQLAEHAIEHSDAGVLVFVDADVTLSPGAVPAALAEQRRQGADVFSVFCRQSTGSWAERLLVPMVEDVLLCFLPFPLLAAPVPAAATANGAILAFRRSAYHTLGGHAAVRTAMVEDIALARRTRKMGLRLGLALGGELAQVRMYENYREIIAGFGRSLVPAFGGHRGWLLLGLLGQLGAYTVPIVLAPRSGLWRSAALLGMLERALVEAKTGRRDWVAALAAGAAPMVAVPVVAQAMRRRQTWRGRVYS